MPTIWLACRLDRPRLARGAPARPDPQRRQPHRRPAEPAWDPERQVHACRGSRASTGIAYNLERHRRELTSIEDLLDPAFKGKIGMLTEMRDTVGLFMLRDGDDLDEADASTTAGRRLRQARAGRTTTARSAQFTGNDYIDDLVAGNFAAVHRLVGRRRPARRSTIPTSGSSSPSRAACCGPTCMVIPKGAENVADAAKWMDYVYDPVNAARITAERAVHLARRRACRTSCASSGATPRRWPTTRCCSPTRTTSPSCTSSVRSTRTRRRSSTSGSPRSPARAGGVTAVAARDGSRPSPWVGPAALGIAAVAIIAIGAGWVSGPLSVGDGAVCCWHRRRPRGGRRGGRVRGAPARWPRTGC